MVLVCIMSMLSVFMNVLHDNVRDCLFFISVDRKYKIPCLDLMLFLDVLNPIPYQHRMALRK